MALKDRLSDALKSTPPENERRIATLRAVMTAIEGGGDSLADSDVQAIVTHIIAEREQKAATFTAAGKSDLAKSEREEIDVLRAFLRSSGSGEPAAAPKKSKPAPAATNPQTGTAAPLFSRNQMIIASVAAVALAIGAILYFFVFSSSSDDNVMVANGQNLGIMVRQDDRTLGNPKAKVTFLEYAAPTCPHCAHFSVNVMPLVKTNYIDTGKVFYIFRTYPLSATDGAVEAIARCLPADKYFPFIDLMFRNQSKWDPDGYQIPDVHAAIIQMARIAGLSAEKVDQCISDKDEQSRINAVALDGERKYSIDHTPTFVVNGEVVEPPLGGDTWLTLKAKFDSLLSKN